MDQTVLVSGDRKVEELILRALDRASYPVTAVGWYTAPDDEESQFYIVTPLLDSKGPREAYKRLYDALQQDGVYTQIPLRIVTVIGRKDPVTRSLIAELRKRPQLSVILVMHGPSDFTALYRPTPNLSRGGMMQAEEFKSEEKLRSFLQSKLGLGATSIALAMEELEKTGSKTIEGIYTAETAPKASRTR